MDDKTSTLTEEIGVSDYSIFTDAHETANRLSNELNDQISEVKRSAGVISDPSVFAGPVADTCKEALELLNTRVLNSSENFTTIGTYFEEIREGYEKGDKKAYNKILMIDEKGNVKVGTGADAMVMKLIDKAKAIANDNKFGYGRGGYGAGNAFDCGGLIWYLLNDVYGLNYNTLQGISPYMLANQLPGYGFERLNVGGPVDQSQLVPGDILINPNTEHGHAALYIGDGKILEARWNYDSASGDSSGDEISINPYYSRIYQSGNYNFNYSTIIRLNNRNQPKSA